VGKAEALADALDGNLNGGSGAQETIPPPFILNGLQASTAGCEFKFR